MTPRALPRRVWMLWILFLIRAAFYCTMLPLWEGWDEYAHFAWFDHWQATHTLPNFDDRMAGEIEESLKLAPLPHELGWMPAPALTHEDWWRLPESERLDRLARLRRIPSASAPEPGKSTGTFYEAQQPPLYYWLLSIPLRLVAEWPLENRVLLTRLLSALIASLAIPLTWAAARHLLDENIALLATAMLAAAAGLAIDASRVANDCAAIALFSLTAWLLTRERGVAAGAALALGTSTGLALLAKGYMLVLLPIIAVAWWRRKRDAAIALGTALLLGGWWYARNVLMGHSLSGWLENPPLIPALRAAIHIDWLATLGVIAKSFLWFGAWSFLTLKSWMYLVLEWTALASAVFGIALHRSALRIPLLIVAAFGAAMIYGSVIDNAVHGVPNLPGWYLWPAGGAVAMAIAAGPRSLAITVIAMLVSLDLYGAAALMLPYYAGLVPYNRADASVFFTALQRLEVPLPLALGWIAATLAIPFVALARPAVKRRDVSAAQR